MINCKIINWIKSKPFYIFEVKNFLEEEFYNKLSKNFPDLPTIEKNKFTVFKNNKYALKSESDIYKEVLENNLYVKQFDNLINSDEFKKIFFWKNFIKILLSRGLNLKHFFKMLRIPKFVKNINRKSFFYKFGIFSKFQITIQYSYILDGGFIVPHPDAGNKLLTLMIYFPEYAHEQKNLQKLEMGIGTTFWDLEINNNNNNHIEEHEKLEDFYKNSNIMYKSLFQKNSIVGFIKNQYSFHSVEPINVHKNYIRKSININIWY